MTVLKSPRAEDMADVGMSGQGDLRVKYQSAATLAANAGREPGVNLAVAPYAGLRREETAIVNGNRDGSRPIRAGHGYAGFGSEQIRDP